MYYLYTVRDVVRVPPDRLGGKIEEEILDLLKKEYEGTIDEDMGVILAIKEVKEIGEGVIIPGDAGVFFETVFDVLVFKPEQNEVVDGIVTDVTEFGAFVRIGPLDGLVHISQVMDDYIRYDPSQPALIGRDTKRKLTIGDTVRARIVSISLKSSIQDTKIGLTMRQPALGKHEWIEAERRKAQEGGKGAKKG